MKTSSERIIVGTSAKRGGLLRPLALLAGVLTALGVSQPARAAFHLWAVDEVYSSADGTVQFIELRETSGGFGGQHPLASNGAFIRVHNASTTNVFPFPTNLPSGSANKAFIIGTAKLASVPGGVTPNYVVANNFVPLSGGTIAFRSGTSAIWDQASYGAVPTNGDSGMIRSGGNLIAVATNSPKNYANQSNSIVSVKFLSANRTGSEFQVSFRTATGVNGAAGPNYAVESSGSFSPPTWSVATNVTGNGATRTLALPINPATNQLFRLRVP